MSRRNKGTGRGFRSQEAYEDIDVYLFDNADYSYSKGYNDEISKEEEDKEDNRVVRRTCRPTPNKYKTAFEAHVLLTSFSHNGKRSRTLGDFSLAEDLIDLMDSFEE